MNIVMTPKEIRSEISEAMAPRDVERIDKEVYLSTRLLDTEIRMALAEAESLKLAVNAFTKLQSQ